MKRYVTQRRRWLTGCLPGLALAALLAATAAAQEDNLALNRPYTMTPAPSYGLCTEAGDATELTDGAMVEPARGQIWVDPRCVGWQSREPVEVIIDLGRSQPVDGVVVHSGAAPQADVYLPEVTVAVSDDGTDFRVVGRLDPGDLPDTLRTVLRLPHLQTRGRYVMVRLRAPYGQFVFTDEIEVSGGTHDPAVVKLPEERLARLVIDRRSELQRRLDRGLDRLDGRLAEARLTAPFAGRMMALRQEIADLPGTRQGKFVNHDAATAAALAARLQELQAASARRLHPRPRLAVTAISPWAELLPGDVPASGAADLSALSATLGRREYDSQALLLSNLSDAPATVTVMLAAPRAAGWRGQLQLRYASFIATPEGFPLADALPLLDRPLVVPPWESRLLWVTVYTGDSTPGAYQAAVQVAGPAGRRVALDLRVLAPRLPESLPLATYSWQYLDNIPPLQGLAAEAIADLAAHHNNVTILSSNLLARPTQEQVDARGNLLQPLDFTSLEHWVKLTRPISSHGLSWFPSLRFEGQPGTPAHNTYTQWVRQWVACLHRLGLDYDDFFVYPVDESIQNDFVASGRAIRAADPRLRIFANPMMRDRDEILRAAAPYIDLWCPLLPADRPRQMEFIRGTGSTLWSYTVCRRQLSPYSGYLLAPWQAFDLGATGCGFWCYAVGDKWTNRDLWHESAALYAVIYTLEGAPPEITREERIIPSRRWEAWREGVEDYAWLHQLRQIGARNAAARRAVDQAVREVLAQPDDLDLARRHRESTLRALAASGTP